MLGLARFDLSVMKGLEVSALELRKLDFLAGPLRQRGYQFVDLGRRRLRIRRVETAFGVDLLTVDPDKHFALVVDGDGSRRARIALELERFDALQQTGAEPLGLGLEGSCVAILDFDLRCREGCHLCKTSASARKCATNSRRVS